MIGLILPAVLRAFTAGNDLYLAGNYQGAIAAYESVTHESPASPELYYNMGNAHKKLGDSAHAILYYEKSLSLSPRDEDTRANLKKAREELALSEEEKVLSAESFRPPLLARWFTLNESSFLFFSTYIPWTAFVFLFLITGGRGRRLCGRLAAIFAVPAALLGILLIGQWTYAGQRYGILMGPRVEIREGPEGPAQSVGSASGGMKARVIETSTTAGETWYKIELLGGRVGWVKDSSLGLI